MRDSRSYHGPVELETGRGHASISGIPTALQASQKVVRHAKELQDERRRSTQRPLPLWVFPALVFFGWNEVMGLLKSPIWLFACALLLMFLYQLYNDLEVDKEMEKGMPASVISIGHKLVPTSKRIFVHTVQATKRVFEASISDESEAHRQETASSSDNAGPEVAMQNLHDSPVQGLQRRRQNLSPAPH